MSASHIAEGAALQPAALAELATNFERRLSNIGAQLDPSWSTHLGRKWPVLQCMNDAALSNATLRLLLLHECASVPEAARLSTPEGYVTLLPRDALHQALAALALACRPGVLRCCIDRDARTALAGSLGGFFEPLLALSALGAPVSAEAAAWSPLHWTCRGCVDWMAMLRPEDDLLRRLVCLSLPAGLLGMHRRAAGARAQWRPPRAIGELRAGGVAWPC